MADGYQGLGERELVPGTLRGYRFWYLDVAGFVEEPKLRSIHASSISATGPSHLNFPWTPGRMEALCIRWNRWCTATGITNSHGRRIYNINEERDKGELHRGIGNGAGIEPVPAKLCTCGFYGRYVDDYELISGGANDGISMGAFRGPVVFGSIKASGRINLGELGFRSQYAEIEAIAPIFPLRFQDSVLRPGSLLARDSQYAAERYGVPLLPSASHLVKAYPPDDLSVLLGDQAPLKRKPPPLPKFIL